MSRAAPRWARGGLAAALVAATVATAGGAVALLRPGGSRGIPAPASRPDPRPSLVRVDLAKAGRRTLGVVPVGLSIPAIGVRSSLERLRRTSAGQLAAPRDPARAGWYVASAVPGEIGPAVIVGHVDSRTGPAVFARLATLRSGDEVLVSRSDGRTARYRVVTARRYPRSRFPTEQVYGPQPVPMLRLITCGGAFDRGSQRYQDNVVVFASS